MLVLTRRPDEEIVIDGGIRIKVVAVQGGRVRLGIVAPPTVRVDRQEVHQIRPRSSIPDTATDALVPALR
jgi:carbon storage regulator